MNIVSSLLCLGLFFSVVVAHNLENSTLWLPNIVEILQTGYSQEISQPCAQHLEDYINGIISNNNMMWPLKMLDSTAKVPDGILMGHMDFPGNFDECIEITTEQFQGKHCMVQIDLADDSKYNFLRKIRRDNEKIPFKFSSGICVPSTCSADDVVILINNFMENKPDLDFIKASLNETFCSTSDYRPFRSEDWVTMSVIIIILVLALLSTIYDLYQRLIKKTENPHQLWSAFSIYTTGKELFRISQSASQLKCLHGIRFLSMTWVILAHAYFAHMFSNSTNFLSGLRYMNEKSFIPVSNGFVSVDSFFFLSGLLVCLVFFRDIGKKGSYDVPLAFIHRYIRLTPPFAILMLIQATIISRIGNGPFWNTRIDNVERQCRESWWTGILYIQNYMNPMSMCLGQAWYLSADMQMYWISPLILYPLLWFPSYAPFFLGLLVLAAALTNFTIGFVNKLGPNLFMDWGKVTANQFELEYAPFHTRISPWLIGLATGYIICGIQAKKINIRMSKLTAVLGWLGALSILGGTIFGIIRFYPQNRSDATKLEAALYLAFHRVGWGLGLAWVVIACVSGYGGPINDFLSLDIFQPLGKLSYCNFLIHMTLQNFRINSARVNQYIRHFEVVYAFFGDLVMSHLISIPVALLLEFPFTNIDRHFLRKMVIFPFPRRKTPPVEAENKPSKEDEKSETLPTDVEKGKANPAFNET